MTRNPAFILFLFVFTLVVFISVEVGRIYNLKNIIDIEMQRAVNTSTMLAVDDDYRRDKIAFIDTDNVRMEFQNYLTDCMELSSNNQKVVDGKVQYTVVITSMNAVSTPPAFEVEGELHASSLFLSNFTSTQIRIPFRAKAKTVRID